MYYLCCVFICFTKTYLKLNTPPQVWHSCNLIGTVNFLISYFDSPFLFAYLLTKGLLRRLPWVEDTLHISLLGFFDFIISISSIMISFNLDQLRFLPLFVFSRGILAMSCSSSSVNTLEWLPEPVYLPLETNTLYRVVRDIPNWIAAYLILDDLPLEWKLIYDEINASQKSLPYKVFNGILKYLLFLLHFIFLVSYVCYVLTTINYMIVFRVDSFPL